jgi:4-methylaminobutanoate oxidase (formaldehyde-forming)
VPGGYRAIDALRLEKGYRVWGTDVTSETDPYSSGLGFAVRSAAQFLGRDALPPAEGGPQRLVCLVLDDVRSVALGNEPVRTPDGEVVGRVTSGGQGFTTGESIAYAWVPAGWSAIDTQLTVEVFGESVAAAVAAEPRFDPTGARIRA